MAMARTRMAISLCCKGIRQVSVRRFEAGAGQINNNSNKGPHSSEQPLRSGGIPLFHPFLTVTLSCTWWFRVKERHKEEKEEEEANVRLRKMLEERGVNRASCEARIAEIKQKMESGTASSFERLDLARHEEWLLLFTREIFYNNGYEREEKEEREPGRGNGWLISNERKRKSWDDVETENGRKECKLICYDVQTGRMCRTHCSAIQDIT